MINGEQFICGNNSQWYISVVTVHFAREVGQWHVAAQSYGPSGPNLKFVTL